MKHVQEHSSYVNMYTALALILPDPQPIPWDTDITVAEFSCSVALRSSGRDVLYE